MSGNSRIPSSQPEVPPPDPVRAIGENLYLGTAGDSPEVVNGYAVLVNREDCEELERSWRSHFGYPLVLQDEERTLWAEEGAEVEVIDTSHPSFTGVRVLDGTHAGRSGWVWLGHVLRTTDR